MSCKTKAGKPDIVVVGATPSGIMAAISSARMGSDVVLLEPTDHIGGIVSNGLTLADIVKRNAVGGLFKEYANCILRYYEDKYGKDSDQVKQCNWGYNSEPHVAEQIFHQMLDSEPRIDIFYNHRLSKVLKQGNKLVGIVAEDLSVNKKQKSFYAKVFIDATYEGDLAAMAGAKYRVGRESRSEFNEKQAGLIYSRFGFDEYLPGSTGNADKAIQAYCFRLSMTRDSNNRVNIIKPDTYNRKDYHFLIDDINTGKLAPLFESHLINRDEKFQPVQMWIKPNNKVEVNNEHVHPIVGAPRESVDLAEENWGYPEASYEERERIVKRYLDYQLGLIWFLQNDPELPIEYRDEARKWGLCKDEFVTNNHVPRQIYVRETRRIEGEYFLTQHDGDLIPEIGRTQIQSTSIGIAEYPFDSHGCHKYNPQYPGTREGYFYIKHDPFQIPYGVIVPQKIDGLLVPVCVSASHVAYQAIRMEPVFMSLGQVAGIAASLSVASGKTVRNIDISKLQRLFVAQKGVITYFEDVAADDPDFEAFQLVGATGGIKRYIAGPDSIMLFADAVEALKRLTGKEVTYSNILMGILSGAELSTWVKNLNWSYSGPTSGEVTVRQFVNAVYVNFDRLCPTGLAQGPGSSLVIHLKNNKYLSIQACTDQIFRIRISAKADFPETLMERYGILKTDWSSVKVTAKKEKVNLVIQTTGFQLSVNEETGDISVRDSKRKMVISNVHAFGEENGLVFKELRTSLNQYFGGGKQADGIIGDSQNTGTVSGSVKSANKPGSSVLEVSLNADERFYGGGSTSRTNIQHRGTALRMWATYQKTEIPMPFIMSSEGWGIFNNTTLLNYFDIGRFQRDKLFICNTGEDIDFYLMLGTSMNELIDLYTTITGKPYLLPKWAYGLAFGGNTLEDQMDIMNDAVRFRDEKIPCDIFWLEPQWMSVNYDFTTSKNWNLDKFRAEPFWELKKFPKYENPMLFIAKLHNLGFKLALWLCIDHDMSIEEEDRIAEKAGLPQSGLEHWFPHLTKFMDQGVDGFKLDPGRTLDMHPDRKYFNGYTDEAMHNLNQVLLPKQMYETFREHKGVRSFHHYCGGYAGTQHWGVSTSGDNGGGKDALFDQLNLGLSGFVNTSVDVMDVFSDNKAALHFGFFLPWVQVNSWYGLHHPWYLKPDEKETFRYYAQLRNSLSPYIYSAALQGSQTGMPILRAMPLVFPDDRNVDNMIYQYMFGENLLVSVFSDSIYLPRGTWINYWTGEKYEGGITVHCKVPENRGGLLFIRGGAIIPYQKTMQYIGEHPVDTLIVKVFPKKQSSYTLWEDDGRSFDYEKGTLAKTKFECMDTDRETEFIISPLQGSYSGIPETRTYQLEIESPHKPSQVLINGSRIDDWKYGSSGKIILSVYQNHFREKQVIKIFKNESY